MNLACLLYVQCTHTQSCSCVSLYESEVAMTIKGNIALLPHDWAFVWLLHLGVLRSCGRFGIWKGRFGIIASGFGKLGWNMHQCGSNNSKGTLGNTIHDYRMLRVLGLGNGILR